MSHIRVIGSENEYNLGEVIVADFSQYGFRTGPTTVVGIHDGISRFVLELVRFGMRQIQILCVAQGEGGLSMDTYFQCTITYAIDKGNVKRRCGVLEDSSFNSICEKVDDFQRRR